MSYVNDRGFKIIIRVWRYHPVWYKLIYFVPQNTIKRRPKHHQMKNKLNYFVPYSPKTSSAALQSIIRRSPKHH